MAFVMISPASGNPPRKHPLYVRSAEISRWRLNYDIKSPLLFVVKQGAPNRIKELTPAALNIHSSRRCSLIA